MKLRNFLISGNFNFSSPFLLSSISRLMIHPHVLCNFFIIRGNTTGAGAGATTTAGTACTRPTLLCCALIGAATTHLIP
jgi:hypothetical protein